MLPFIINKNIAVISEAKRSFDLLNIEAKELDDAGSLNNGLMNAQKFIKEDGSVAVAHNESYISIPASSLYNISKAIMLTPASTSTELKTGNNIYRAIPSDAYTARALSKFCKEFGYKRVVATYSENSYGKSFVNAFEKSGIEVVDRISFNTEKEFKKIIDIWKNYNFDAVLFVGYEDDRKSFIEELRKSFLLPVLITEPLSHSIKDNDNIIAPQFVNIDSEKYKEFFDLYIEKYNTEPTYIDAISYDLANILMNFEGNNIKEYLNNLEYDGVAYKYIFNDGELEVDNIIIEKLYDGKVKRMGRF